MDPETKLETALIEIEQLKHSNNDKCKDIERLTEQLRNLEEELTRLKPEVERLISHLFT